MPGPLPWTGRARTDLRKATRRVESLFPRIVRPVLPGRILPKSAARVLDRHKLPASVQHTAANIAEDEPTEPLISGQTIDA